MLSVISKLCPTLKKILLQKVNTSKNTSEGIFISHNLKKKKKNKSRYFQGKCLVTASILELFQHQNSSFLIQLCWIDTKPGYFLSLQAKSIFISATDQSFHIDMLNAFYLCFKLIATGNYSRYWLILKLYCPIFIQLAVLKNLNQNDFCFYFCFHTGYYFLPC